MKMKKELADVGMIGLAVMGENLALNMERNGYTVAVWNLEVEVVDRFVKGRGKGKNFVPTDTLQELVASITRPRKIMMMIRAGEPVDLVINQLLPYLDKGDIIIDGGNSHYTDTNRRYLSLKRKGIHFVGTGVSGGEEGALNGPSLMPGGAVDAWPEIQPLFQKIAAKLADGTPCCDWIGEGGAGHFVKMVHNGIEYGDMQLISEAYCMLAHLGSFNIKELQHAFAKWNQGDLESYLIEITANIFEHRDKDGKPLIDKILDVAGQKGTGKWAVDVALDMGVPLTLISESVFARSLSALKEERIEAAKILGGVDKQILDMNKATWANYVENALYGAKIISYAQGFSLLRAASKEYKWNLNYSSIALIWREGCIIRSAFLEKISDAYKKNPDLTNLVLDPFFMDKIKNSLAGWRIVACEVMRSGCPSPALISGLSYYDAYRSDRLPANLIQAQRDYFGAHTYERIDRPRGEFFHTDWTNTGGSTSSTTYNV